MTKKDFKDSITTQTTQLSSPAMAFVSANVPVVQPPAFTPAEAVSESKIGLAHVSEAREAVNGSSFKLETKSKKTHLICRPSDMECALKIATMRRVSFNELMNIYTGPFNSLRPIL
ncbi:hypothetical protein FACS1894122_15500 [Alphaproteobacteria bacterium]|nr:hypothetical protein FACS1894122_15500 [Alphaproteobacteria bacterium]